MDDFATKLDRIITEAKDAGMSLDDISSELRGQADGLDAEAQNLEDEDTAAAQEA